MNRDKKISYLAFLIAIPVEKVSTLLPYEKHADFIATSSPVFFGILKFK